MTKPVASRSTSAEIYVVGLRYKAPARIDPRLLDFKHLFQGAINPPKVINLILICCANSFINASFFFFSISLLYHFPFCIVFDNVKCKRLCDVGGRCSQRDKAKAKP